MSNLTILILVAVGMACILGGITLVTHLYNLNGIKAKTVGNGQHGTARWATKREIRKTYRFVSFAPKKWRAQAACIFTLRTAQIVPANAGRRFRRLRRSSSSHRRPCAARFATLSARVSLRLRSATAQTAAKAACFTASPRRKELQTRLQKTPPAAKGEVCPLSDRRHLPP